MNDILLLGIFLSLIFTELTDLSPGGIIVPAYFAMYAYDWKRLLGTIILALLCMLIVHFMSKYMILYGRRRYAVYIMTGVLLKFLIGSMGAGVSFSIGRKTGHTENTDSAGNRDSFNPSYLHNCEVAQ